MNEQTSNPTSGQNVPESKFRRKSRQEQTAASKLRMERRGEKLDAAREKLAKQKPPKKPGAVKRLAHTAGHGVHGFVHGKLYEVEHENVGTEGAHRSELAAESVYRFGRRKLRKAIREHPAKAVERAESKHIKATADYYYRKTVEEHPEMQEGGAVSRYLQKQKIKRQYAKQAREAARQTAKAAEGTASVTGKLTEKVSAYIKEHPGGLLLLLAAFLLLVVLQSCMSSLVTVGNGVAGAIGASTYAAEDADVTLQLKNRLEKELAKDKMEKLFYEMEMPLTRVLADMEIAGVNVDTAELKSSSDLLTRRLGELEQEIYQLAGTTFNVSSARQVGEILFERLKIDEKAKKTKTGQYSTTEEILEKLRSRHPIVGKILDQRGIRKLLSTYINALPELINPKTGKIHTSFNQTVTATGRLSSSNPNLQNIPIRDNEGREIRRAFVPDPGCLFFSADYSQIELRIMAHLSGDPHMIGAFREGSDIHAATAAKIYKVPIGEVTADMRRKAKTANFGIIYGISVFGLAERLNIPRSEAKELIDGYFESYPQIKEYMNKSIEVAREKGYVETICGRKRMLPDIHSHNSVVRGYAERNAINAPIQGSAADIIKIAMIRIARRFEEEGLKSRMILQVHDELNFNVPTDELERVQEIVRHEMESAYPLQVPLVADYGTGHNWLEAH